MAIRFDERAPSFDSQEDFDRFRSILLDGGYTPGKILERIGYTDLSSVRSDDLPLLMRRTKGAEPLDSFIRLFLMEAAVSARDAQRAFKPMELETLCKAGLLQIDGASVRASVKLVPFQDLLIAFDLSGRLQTDCAHDYVMGIGSSSLTLANLTVRSHSRLTLDLGAGCGVQTLFAARHSDRVVAVDRNARAVQFADFNARLNELSSIESLEGDFFEPVQGKTFDLIVSNPPFVISPETRYIYRDGGMQGDMICRKIAREAPHFLNEGGFCQILCNWAEYSGENWRERLEKWFEGSGCDVWVMRSETRDAASYASTWIRHTEKAQSSDFAQRFDEWMSYYERQGIEAMSAGLISMRRSSGRANWFKADESPEKMLGKCGEHVVQGFKLKDFLESLAGDSDLLAACLCASPDVRLDKSYEISEEAWVETGTQLSLKRGLAYSGRADAFIAELVAGCDGRRPLRDLLVKMAKSLHVSPEEISSALCGIVRGLIERGFLLPVSIAAEGKLPAP